PNSGNAHPCRDLARQPQPHLNCKGSDARLALVGRKRERADRGADAKDTPPRQIAIGMLNDVKSGHLIKILWHDGIGMSLYSKRLERGRFIWPSPADGTVAITAA